jgi:DNA-binding response OmpR family regulator
MRPIAAHPLSDPYARSAVVIDADAAHAERLAASLRQQGFTVHTAGDGSTGLEAVRRFRPDLTTVDVNLPGIDGFETVRRLRAFSDGFVLMLTADDSESAVVEGFRAGADDYIIKPYGPHALRARIDALLRRSRSLASAARVEDESPWLEQGPLRLHPGSRRVEVDGVERELTRSEFDLLFTLMRAKDQVFSKASLAVMLRETNGLLGHHITTHDRHAVEVHIMNLRRKLGDDPRSPQWIETVRGFGYRLAPASSRVPVLLHAAVG